MAPKKTVKENKKTDVVVSDKSTSTSRSEKKFILSPHVTEKASKQSEINAYTFVVAKEATKQHLMNEIIKDYKVTPKYINITNLPRRNVFVRGKKGTVAGIKKAVVFLKKGDTMKLV